jgi:hypothetical protein
MLAVAPGRRAGPVTRTGGPVCRPGEGQCHRWVRFGQSVRTRVPADAQPTDRPSGAAPPPRHAHCRPEGVGPGLPGGARGERTLQCGSAVDSAARGAPSSSSSILKRGWPRRQGCPHARQVPGRRLRSRTGAALPARAQRRRGLRLLVPLASLLTAPAVAHEPDFDFLAPQGLDTVVEGGPVLLRWRGTDSRGTSRVELYASSGAATRWRPAQTEADLHLTSRPLPLATAAPEFSWDTTGLPPGCYQPYAAVREPGENWYFVVPGKVVVRTATSVPPSVWFTNAPGDELDRYGHFVIRYRIHDPDSATTVSLAYGDGTSLHPIADGLVHPVGGGEGTVEFDASGLENGYYELHARVEAPGEPACEAFWTDVFYVPGGPYWQRDEELPDAGTPDGGEQEPPSPPVLPTPPGGEQDGGAPGDGRSRGCSAAPGGWLALGFALLVRWWRRPHAGRTGRPRGHASS